MQNDSCEGGYCVNKGTSLQVYTSAVTNVFDIRMTVHRNILL